MPELRLRQMSPPEITRSSDRRRPRSGSPSAKKEKPRQSSQSYAIWHLSRREYSAAELRKKIIQRGYSEEEADLAMAFVQENNYQSDERYAGIKARSTAHRAGNRKIQMVLRTKGVGDEIAQAQIDTLVPESQRAIEAVEKFKKLAADGMTRELSTKIWRYLSYRGFSSDAIKQALRALDGKE
jgi:regulatory protein